MNKSWRRYLVLILGVIGLSIPAAASAGKYRNIEIEYYSDSTYSEQVGYFLQTCHAQVYMGGERTEYAVKLMDEPC